MKKLPVIFFYILIAVGFFVGCDVSKFGAGSSQIETYVLKCKIGQFDSVYNKLVISKKIFKPDSILIKSFVDSINIDITNSFKDSAYVRFLRQHEYDFNKPIKFASVEQYYKNNPYLIYDSSSNIIFKLDTALNRFASNQIGLIVRWAILLPDYRGKNWELKKNDKNKVIEEFESKYLPYFNQCEDRNEKK